MFNNMSIFNNFFSFNRQKIEKYTLKEIITNHFSELIKIKKNKKMNSEQKKIKKLKFDDLEYNFEELLKRQKTF